jgi:hypothetical protein
MADDDTIEFFPDMVFVPHRMRHALVVEVTHGPALVGFILHPSGERFHVLNERGNPIRVTAEEDDAIQALHTYERRRIDRDDNWLYV